MINKTIRIFFILILEIVVLSCAVFKPTEPGAIVPATADQDKSLPSLRINGCTFHLETFGNPNNQVIIFLHGGALDYKAFLSFTYTVNGRSLKDDYFLVLFDQRGKGLSQRFNSKDDISFDIYQRDLEGLINHFSPDRDVIFIAHSFGGIITANYLNTHPDRVAGSVLLEPGEFKSSMAIIMSLDITHEWVNDLMWGQQILGGYTHEEADFHFAAIMASKDFNPLNRTVVRAPFWRVGAAAQHWLSSEPYDFTKNLPQLDKPLLFITGSETQSYGVELQKENMEYLPHSYMKVIEGAGHSDIVWSRSVDVIPLIFDYLDSLKEGENK